MYRHFVLFLLLLASLAAFAAVTTTVVVNGKTVAVPMIEANGKAYVDAVALMKILGGSATYTAANHKVVISTTATTTTTGGGTVQLAGDNGEFGKIYSLKKRDPLNFTLLRAEYTTTPVNIDNMHYAPKVDEKLLVLHFTVQNPQKTETLARDDMLKFTVVDADDVNHEGRSLWGDEESHARVALNLKPAQKIAAYAVITVPAKGVIPKLMVQPVGVDNGPILRYDLRDKVTALQAPIADPADPTGATALATVPAKVGTVYPYERFAVTVEKFDFTTEELTGVKPKAGERFLLTTLLVKNLSPGASTLRNDMLTPTVFDADGGKLTYRDMLFATANRRIAQDIDPNTEMRVRLFFIVPKDSTPKKFTLKEKNSRTYEFEIP